MRRCEDSDLRARGARVLLLVSVLVCTAAPIRHPAAQASALALWYDKPTAALEEALPLGNGRLGAMVFGDVASERVMLNDSALWAGGPINPEVNPEAIAFLPKVREALFKGDYRLADQLTKKLQGKYSQSYAPLGDLYIDASLPARARTDAFRRQLDVETATARTSFSWDQAAFTRDYFVSYPDRVLVIRLTASAPGALAFSVRADSQLCRSVTVDGRGDLVLAGRAPKHAEPNYRGNINTEMNYWPAKTTNLAECHQPLLRFIGDLAKTGAVTARHFYDCSGWCAHHNSDIWAISNPVGNLGEGSPVWANWPMSGLWFSLHLWERYAFGGDRAWLQSTAYPLMKGAAEFALDWLVHGPDGFLVTAPSTSPENQYKTPDGYVGAVSVMTTADLALVRGALLNLVQASEVLGVDAAFRDKVKAALAKLPPYRIGKRGNLQEWYLDWDDQDPQHRHVSHLIGLYPDDQINSFDTPELAAAVRRSLELRGDGGTGWSKAWKIGLWARLLDGDHAYRMLRTHLQYVGPAGDTQYKGGGFTVDEVWKDGRLVEAVVRADHSGKVRVRYGSVVREFGVKAGVAARYTVNMF